jgi:hypothetical protein
LVRKGDEEPPPLELKPLPEDLRYEFLDEEKKCPVIISSKLSSMEIKSLLDVLMKHCKVFGYSLTNIKGIDPSIITHKIIMEDDAKPFVDTQKRMNPKMKEVIRKEVIRLLDAGIIYQISDNKWVSPAHCIPKDGEITIITNGENSLIPTITITSYSMCIDFSKFNKDTKKNHKPPPLMEQVLESLSSSSYFYFLDGYSRCTQIPIQPEDQEKTTITCLYGAYAYRLLPFGLCNVVATFYECVLKIFEKFVENIVEVLMDDFDVYNNTFDKCLNNLDQVLQECRKVNLVLNWERCRFMIREGKVFGQKFLRRGL